MLLLSGEGRLRADGCTGEVGKVFPGGHRLGALWVWSVAVTALWGGKGYGVPLFVNEG